MSTREALRARVRQRAALSLLPPIAQRGAKDRPAKRASVVGQAKFRPAQRGRRVAIERRVGRGPWRRAARVRQNRRGVVRFTEAAVNGRGRAYTYRAVALRYRGIRRFASTAKRTDGWRLHFTDEFSGRSLNLKKWEYRALGERSGASGRATAESSKSAVDVGGGIVKLMVRRMPGEPGVYRNGHIGTQGKYGFRYGIAAARIKFPRGRGQHGSFWMQPTEDREIAGSPRRNGAEIDVAEFFGAGYPGGGFAHFVYWLTKSGDYFKHGDVFPRATRMLPRRDAWWKNYHVFSVEWTPRRYTFRVDGRKTWATDRGVSGVQQYLILSLLTSEWELPHLRKSTLPTSMKVDWARVWKP